MDELKLLVQNTQKAWLLLFFLFNCCCCFVFSRVRLGFSLYLRCCTTTLTGFYPNYLVNIEVQREKQKCLMHIKITVLLRP